MISILSIYRGKYLSDRGTAIRVKSILSIIRKSDLFSLHTATWDSDLNIENHTFLNNSHLAEIYKLLLFVRRKNIDVVIGHTISSIYYLFIIKLFTNAKTVLEMHGFLEEEEYMYGNIGKLNFFLKKFIFSIMYSFTDLITTCSETATHTLRKYNNNVITVYGGYDENIFYPRPRSVIGSEKLIVGYAGNARVWQGLNFALDALCSVENIEFRILCSEKKWKPDKKYSFFTKLYDPSSHGKVPDFLKECDILIIPRLQNEVNRLSFPSKLIEFMAMGKSVIASATSDCHKIIKNRIDGILFTPGNKQELQMSLEFLRDRNNQEQIGRNALLKVSNFTWNKQVDIILNNIIKLCQKKTGK